jgi:holo-[acyl-carrier protein] synthase
MDKNRREMNMIKGIGLDIVEMSRIEMIMKRHGKFIERVLTEKEQAQFHQYQGWRQVEFLAGRFSAKEAYAKANGTGIGTDLSFQDIEVSKDKLGKPYFSKPAKARAHLSITHSKDFAAAQVIVEE